MHTIIIIKTFFIGVEPAEKEADKLYAILFDKAFVGGLTLCGSKSQNRCYRLHRAAMLNISHGSGERVYQESDSIGFEFPKHVRTPLTHSFLPFGCNLILACRHVLRIFFFSFSN